MSAFDAYVQAAFHGGTMPGGPTFTVVHDAETPLDYGYADAIAEFFRRGPKAGTSAHAMIGPEKAVKLLPDNVVAWAAGPYANPRGWHLEQTGYARFSRADWTTAKGIAQIGRTANCVREVHDTWSIPKRWVTDDQLRRAAKGDRASGGMTTHQQVARVLGGTTHTDPEERYPRDLLLQAVLGGSPAPDLGDDMSYVQWPQADRERLLIEIREYAVKPAILAMQKDIGRAVLCLTPEDRDGAWAWDRLAHIEELAQSIAEKIGGGLSGGSGGGISRDDVKAAVQEALREGTGAPANPAS